ncbi:hypothetical protein Tco_0979035 [Tanacetum coccineum]|uniref:Uncharacterized protein n=1 Tax=Tanacetum coccineum TaxID=301880 RepID=A0ABQ5EQ96_9ASTR
MSDSRSIVHVLNNSGILSKQKTVNREVQLQALVDKKKVIIIESTIRRDLQQEDTEGQAGKAESEEESGTVLYVMDTAYVDRVNTPYWELVKRVFL